MRERRRRITLHMKSGDRVRVRVREFTSVRNGFGEITELTWTHRWWHNKNLGSVRVSDIVAVVYSRW